MDRDRAQHLLGIASRALGGVSRANLLDDIGWSRDVEERFFASGENELPAINYQVDRDALEKENVAIAEAERLVEGDEPIPVWLRAALGSARDRNRLLLAAGTKEFGRLSREIYGSADTAFFGLPLRNLDLANHLLARLEIHGDDEARDREETPIDARAFAEELTRRIGKQRPEIDIKVVVDPKCASKAIAGMKKVRVRADATFLSWEADGLFCHEVETHAFTAHNGAAQPNAPFLKSGGPRTTATQEGLAVFAELYNRALAVPRLERLAVRVKLVEMASEGASFVDLYRHLVGRGSKSHDAFLDAARICRGGLVTGGAPFTKDACYLAGLLHVYAFLAAFVRGGFRDETELLVAGRISLEDVLALAQLRRMGLVLRPRHRPRWLRRWSTLVPYFAFTSFWEGIDLRAVTEQYQDLIAQCEQPSAAT